MARRSIEVGKDNGEDNDDSDGGRDGEGNGDLKTAPCLLAVPLYSWVHTWKGTHIDVYTWSSPMILHTTREISR
jgi:hypothetical protein